VIHSTSPLADHFLNAVFINYQILIDYAFSRHNIWFKKYQTDMIKI